MSRCLSRSLRQLAAARAGGRQGRAGERARRFRCQTKSCSRAKTGFGVPTGAWMDAVAGARRAGQAIAETKGLASRRWSQVVLAALASSRARCAQLTAAPAMLALVTDAFGGRGGIAQYNRDFFSALAEPRSKAWPCHRSRFCHAMRPILRCRQRRLSRCRRGQVVSPIHWQRWAQRSPGNRYRLLRPSLHGAACGADRRD